MEFLAVRGAVAWATASPYQAARCAYMYSGDVKMSLDVL